MDGEIDLRGVIYQFINQEGKVNNGGLMHDLESLFQKKLIDIRIKLFGVSNHNRASFHMERISSGFQSLFDHCGSS